MYLCVVEALETLVEGVWSLAVRVAIALALQAAVGAHEPKVALALVRLGATTMHAPLRTHRNATAAYPNTKTKTIWLNLKQNIYFY